MARTKKKGFSVNLNDAESYFRPPVDHYECEIEGVEAADSGSLAWDFKITAGRFKGKSFRGYTQTGEALWTTRQLVEATGEEVEDAEVGMDYFEGLVGKELTVQVDYREWEGKEKLNLRFHPAGSSDEEEEDEKPKKKSKKPRDEEEDEDEDEKPKSRRSKKPARDEEEDEEEEEDEKPSRSKKKKKKAELTPEEIQDMDVDDLEALVTEYELEVDLSDFKTLKKQQSAVIKAAEEAGLIE